MQLQAATSAAGAAAALGGAGLGAGLQAAGLGAGQLLPHGLPPGKQHIYIYFFNEKQLQHLLFITLSA